MLLLAALTVAPIALSGAPTQQFTYELEAHRKPRIQTDGDAFISNARILTVSDGIIERGDIIVRNGKIAEIGEVLDAPDGFEVIDGEGLVAVPGFVDAHIHRGISGTNEGSNAVTAEVQIGLVLNPFSTNVWQALASGETTGLALHGSANPIGGESQVVKLKYGTSMAEMRVPDAPRMIKFALGENVTRKGSENSDRFPLSRMGQQAVYRRAFLEAQHYMKLWEDYENGDVPRPRKDLRLETLVDILRGDVWVHCHSYRADEILMMARLSEEFGFKIGAMTHGVEAYKVAPELAEAGVGASLFADSHGFKLEAIDGTPYNAAINVRAGVLTSVNTDGTGGTTAVNIDAAKSMRFGGLSGNEALSLLTINPAKQLGVDHRVGSLEEGKDADIVLWDGHPMSVYAKPVLTMIEGVVYFQRRDAFGVDASATLKTHLDEFEYRIAPPTLEGAESYAIANATLHTVSDGVIHGTLIIRDGQIEAVGERVPIPSGAGVIDGTGLHVYPGFIDGGTQIGLYQFGQVGQATDTSEHGDFQPDLMALTAVNCESSVIADARFNGTLVAVIRGGADRVVGQAAIAELNGYTREQMKVMNPAALYVRFPSVRNFRALAMETLCACSDSHGHPEIFASEAEAMAVLNNLALAMQFQRREAEDIPRQIEEMEAFFVSAEEYLAKKDGDEYVKPNAKFEAMIPYLRGELPVIINVRNAASIRAAVDFGDRHGLKVILEGAPDAWKEATMLAERNIPVLIRPAGESTLGANSPANPYDPYDTPYALPYLLAEAGVRFAFLTDESHEAMNLPFRVGMSCAYGLSPERAIRALTLDAAEILGVGDRLGSLEVGKDATLFVVDGDPLDLRANMLYQFIGGQPVPVENRFTYLRDKYFGRLD